MDVVVESSKAEVIVKSESNNHSERLKSLAHVGIKLRSILPCTQRLHYFLSAFSQPSALAAIPSAPSLF